MSTLLDHINLGRLRLKGFRSHFVPTAHGRVHALVGKGTGDLPPVVLIAGLSSRATHFARMVPYLQDKVRRLVLIDLPGHGLSEVPLDGLTGPSLQGGMLAALDAVIDEPAVVFGNSLGGFMGLRHALHSPSKVRGLVLVSPGGAQLDAMGLVEFFQRFRLRTFQDALQLIDRVFWRVHPAARLVMAFFARRQLSRPHVRHLLNTSEARHLLTQEELRGLRVPVRLIWGTADGVLPRSHLDFFKGSLPGADWYHPSDYGHSPYLEVPEDVAEHVLAFLRELTAERPRLVEAS